MERDYNDAANTGVYIAGAIADATTINDLRTQLTAALARAEKAEAELQILQAVPISIDTPNEVCDGIVSAPVGQIIADYGVEALGWIMDASKERADFETLSSRCVKAETERDAYAKAKAENDDRFQIEARVWKDLYTKAWAECIDLRQRLKVRPSSNDGQLIIGDLYHYMAGALLPAANAHDAARKDAGLWTRDEPRGNNT